MCLKQQGAGDKERKLFTTAGATGELKDVMIDDVIEGLQKGEFDAIEQAARQHVEHVRHLGLRDGAHYAFNGKLFPFRGLEEVHIARTHAFVRVCLQSDPQDGLCHLC
jgi:hypothetical protein